MLPLNTGAARPQYAGRVQQKTVRCKASKLTTPLVSARGVC